MARITKGNLNYQLKALGHFLRWNMPDHGGTYVEGAVFIEKWSPGDGVTRYSVKQLTDAGGERTLMGPWLGIGQAYEALKAAHQAAELVVDERHARKSPARKRNPVKKRRRTTSRKRKPPRTAAQIAATRKLVALNKRRAKKRPPKKLTLAEKRKRAASRKRRTIFEKKHHWAIKAHIGKTCRWWTGKGFALVKDLGKNPKRLYKTQLAAEKAALAMRGRLPPAITSLEITRI